MIIIDLHSNHQTNGTIVKRRMRFTLGLLPVVLLFGLASFVLAQTTDDRPSEHARLDTNQFRKGLQQRGLFELLELHLKDYPPKSDAARLLYDYELARTIYEDDSLPIEERAESLKKVHGALRQLITVAPHDPRRFEWTIELARSLIYEKGEPYFTSILYRGGDATDRKKLLQTTGEALSLLRRLKASIESEYERIDTLPLSEFEALEGGGYVEMIDNLAPQVEYLLLWTLYYDSLPRDDEDPARAAQLNEIAKKLEEMTGLLTTPHEQSKVQAQGQLLAGMTFRLLNKHLSARDHFERLFLIASRINDPMELRSIQWAIILGHVETVRNELDDTNYQTAARRLAEFRAAIEQLRGDQFGLELIATLLEREIHKARLQQALENDDETGVDRLRVKGWSVVLDLLKNHPQRRDEVYAVLYDNIGADADHAALDPIEQCAMLAGLLYDASLASSAKPPNQILANDFLDRAIEVAEAFLAQADRDTIPLKPQVIYNLAVAQYRRGRLIDSAQRFVQVAENHGKFDKSLQAITLAVQIYAKLNDHAQFAKNPGFRTKYIRAMEVLVSGYAASETAQYWRFFYAQLLDEDEQFDAAAVQFSMVHPKHEHYLESVFLSVRCRALGLRAYIELYPNDWAEITKRFDQFESAQRNFVALASARLNAATEPERIAELNGLLARAALTLAEVLVLPEVNKPGAAIRTVANFEETYPKQKTLVGRMLRVRLLAFEQLGKLDEATKAIPQYIASDPKSAGPTLQSLFLALVEDIERLRRENNEEGASQKSLAALMIAQQIDQWATKNPQLEVDRKLIKLQLAEANLRAQRYDTARLMFINLLELKEDSEFNNENMTRPRPTFGYADSLFHLGKYGEALPIFNRLAMLLSPDEQLRWRSLLRDLQCRMHLNEPPGHVLKVISQQEVLHPEMGGENLKREFDRLKQQNRKR